VSARSFVVHVARLRRANGHHLHEVRHGPFDPEGVLVPVSAAESSVPAGAEARADVTLESFPGGIMVTGTVGAPWAGLCRRCAAAVGGELVVSVKERYVGSRQLGPAAGPAVDEDAYPIVDEELDLYPMVRDALVLELPLAPLCRPDCAGLCNWCGADRNEVDCGCVAPGDPRWASLDVLRTSARGNS
jgi:uncharacterized protein